MIYICQKSGGGVPRGRRVIYFCQKSGAGGREGGWEGDGGTFGGGGLWQCQSDHRPGAAVTILKNWIVFM